MAKGGRSGGRSHGGSHSRGGSHSHFGGGHRIGGGHHFGGGHHIGHHGSSFSHHHHRHYGRRSGPSYETIVDSIANINTAPTVVNGTYTLQGSQINVIARMNQPLSIATVPIAQFENPVNLTQGIISQGIEMQAFPPQMAQMGQMMPPPMIIQQAQTFTEASLTVVGAKTSPGDGCCVILTMLLGMCLIFPLFFMCCMWWKKIVNPLYSLAPQFYRAVGMFLMRERQCRMLNLVVYDNNFSAQKARMLYESLSTSSLTGFSFTNGVIPCNYLQDEADSFMTNVSILKSLPFPTQIRWDDMIL